MEEQLQHEGEQGVQSCLRYIPVPPSEAYVHILELYFVCGINLLNSRFIMLCKIVLNFIFDVIAGSKTT